LQTREARSEKREARSEKRKVKREKLEVWLGKIHGIKKAATALLF
jgi:hypothetical protein